MATVRRSWFRLPALMLLAALAGCATTGDIPVDIDESRIIYISPANEDGVQDAVSFPLSVIPLERTILKRYKVTVTDPYGVAIRTLEESVPSGGLFRRNRKATVEAPEIVLWDGRDDSGKLVADGEYLLVVRVWDNRNNEGVSPRKTIVVDNKAPYAEVSSPFLLFTPNGDDRLEQLSVYQRRASLEDRWVGTFRSASGQPVREFTWTGGARDFTWDGQNQAGSVAAEGTYSYTLTATDRAGNTGTFELAGINLERDARPISVTVSRGAFSPNGDGRADTIMIRPNIPVVQNLERWLVEVRDISARAVRTWEPTGAPQAIEFDGRDNAGNPIPDGQYLATLRAVYSGGQDPETASPIFVVDTSPPQASIAASWSVFSPDGDGLKDTVDVLQSSTDEGVWRGTLTAPDGTQVRSATWRGRVAGFTWDGTDSSGRVLPDGIYTYRLYTVDDGDNEALPTVQRIRIDTAPVPVQITPSAQRFSPNGDGIQDTITLTLGVTQPAGIESWKVVIRNAGGQSVGQLAAGAEVVPPTVQWNGRLNGSVLPDNMYYPEFEVTYEKGTVSSAISRTIRLDTIAPTVTVGFRPQLFSPDDDGTDDVLTITLGTNDASAIDRWNLSIFDPMGQLFIEWTGSGRPPATLEWNGKSRSGELVQSAEDYRIVATATDAVWNTGKAETEVPIDILVIREGDRLRIRIASIYFVPFTADYTNLEDRAQAQQNLATLDRLAQVLKKYPQHSIRVEGHAVRIYWYDAARGDREEREVLLPLSNARAEAIRQALVQRGVQAARMSTFGYGGSQPIVPHSDELNRWKNRRVEFILERR